MLVMLSNEDKIEIVSIVRKEYKSFRNAVEIIENCNLEKLFKIKSFLGEILIDPDGQ